MKRRLFVIAGVLLALVLGAAGTAALLVDRSGYRYARPDFSLEPGRAKDRQQLEARLIKPPTAKVYLVVDRTHNRLELREGSVTKLSAVCSAGSGYVLREPDGKDRKGREWVFDTPRGIRKIGRKITDPAWKRPDWAFVEAGEPIPKNPEDRIEYGMLGEYALYLGDGYMIHGTLYERLLGRGVTHGCIRLGKNDLDTVYHACPEGTPVYIF